MRKRFWKCVQWGAHRVGSVEHGCHWVAYKLAVTACRVKLAGYRVGDIAQRAWDHAQEQRFELIRREYER